jgi:hypothetical protein
MENKISKNKYRQKNFDENYFKKLLKILKNKLMK